MNYKPKEKSQTAFVRDEIEKIVKEEKIDRNRFGEFSKFQYEDIIRKFYYSFSDYKHFAPDAICLNRKRLHIRNDIRSYAAAGVYNTKSWDEYIKKLRLESVLNSDEKYFLILSAGWVYQGYADEIFHVLSKVDSWIQDFFIISARFDWFIAYDCIDLCAFMYQKDKKPL